jgi:hypothetical protein
LVSSPFSSITVRAPTSPTLPVPFIVPVGQADLKAHVCEGHEGRLRDGVISGRCDRMYLVNTCR